MLKKILLSCLLISGNVSAQSAHAELVEMERKGLISPHDMASKVQAHISADVVAKKNTLDMVNMWREATSFMTHEEKIVYTKEFLAALEKQEASMHVEQALLRERQRRHERQLDLQQANAEREQADQAFNQKVKIVVGIAAAIAVVVAIYLIIKKTSNNAEPMQSAKRVRFRDPLTSAASPMFMPSGELFGSEAARNPYGYVYQSPAPCYHGVDQTRTDTPSTLAFDQMRHNANRMYDVGESLLSRMRGDTSSASSRSAVRRSMF